MPQALTLLFTRHPIGEPSFLFGGYPCKELRHKFLMAQESSARELAKESLPEVFAIIPLPGHFFDMAGFRTPDDVTYPAWLKDTGRLNAVFEHNMPLRQRA